MGSYQIAAWEIAQTGNFLIVAKNQLGYNIPSLPFRLLKRTTILSKSLRLLQENKKQMVHGQKRSPS
jgi:hypothetical protein